MGSLLSSTRNTRFLPCKNSKYIRSDFLDNLDDKEISWLIENNIKTIIDLRTQEEIKIKPCSLAQNSAFNYFIMPVTGGNAVPKSPKEVALSYFKMVDQNMLRIIEKIENSQTKVLYFCNAGKDRTGVVSALLLLRMNIDKSIIIEDYLESLNNLKNILVSYSEINPFINLDVITPKSEYMEEFLKLVCQKYSFN